MSDDIKEIISKNFITYASYVILERAIPNIDGLKPVQRRILHTLFTMDDGKFHKVANIVGQTMAFHPHGDAPIYDALVNLANKGFLIARQGNFGNLFTGDPASAARYIEAKLSPLAKETLFNKELTSYIPSYDGRKQEPITLPAKIPLLLMQGAEGIAVGMSTKVLPHNFIELLKAQINIIEEKPFTLIPDFPTGGILDPTEYNNGKGKVKLRAKLETLDDKTLIIKEICYGTTTESLTRSIDEAAKKGKIKIESINDYTSENVEIEIKLPRGHYSDQLIEALYAFTDCQVSLNSQIILIKDHYPWETTTDELLKYQTQQLKNFLKQELEIERDSLLEKIYQKTLEQIFIENRLYKKIENLTTYPAIHKSISENLEPFHKQLEQIPTEDDRERLLGIPIRRISRFDINKNEEEIVELEKRITTLRNQLKNIKKFTIQYLEKLIKKHQKEHPRKTTIEEIEEVDIKKVARKNIKIGVDLDKGYIGSKISSDTFLECTNFDKLLLIFNDGTFKIIPTPEKEYVNQGKGKLIFASIADKKTTFRVLYKDPATNHLFAKRFIVKQFILNKEYNYLEKGMKIEHLTTQADITARIQLKPKARQKISSLDIDLDSITIKGYGAKGIRVCNKEVKKIKILKPKEHNE
jgi:topoisomerase IV subunit A